MTCMSLSPTILESLAAMPAQFERIFRLVPRQHWQWQPQSWEGIPGERFTAVGHACHVRDIEIDGYHVRIRRLIEEHEPDLASIESYSLARERDYASVDPVPVLAAFHAARAETVRILGKLSPEQLSRRGTFAEYGSLTLAGLVHYLCSHDQQHLACLQWLLGRLASA